MLVGTKSILPSKEKDDPEAPNTGKGESKQLNQKQQH